MTADQERLYATTDAKVWAEEWCKGTDVLGSPDPEYHWERCLATRDGSVYWRLIADVPRFPDAYLNSVVYLYPSKTAAESGEPVGGCGFSVRMMLDAKVGAYSPAAVYVVTNRHVVDRGNRCIRWNLIGGGFDAVETHPDDWVSHPHGHDVAVCPILMRRDDYNLVAVPRSDFLTESEFLRAQIGPGDDVFLASRFIGHEGRGQNRPVLHAGVVSQIPKSGEGLLNRFSRLDEPTLVVETHSRPGYSGSPVYGYIHPSQPQLGVERDMAPRTFLLGVAWGYIPSKERLVNDDDSDLPASVTLSSGLAGVLPAWLIAEVLDEPKLVAQRRELEELIREQHPQSSSDEGAEPMDAGAVDGADEFERFQELASKLIKVQKDDVDQLREKD